ncbi:MAG: hypothetical protein V2I39_07520 [Erythrobacter sp.]|jgi:hypothetical protein|nr:hypothetical protein [Erythrobacter sp.]
MRAFLTLCAATVSALALAVPASAQWEDTQAVEQLKSSQLPDLAKGKGYILYETVESKYDIFFLRSLTETELERFAESRAIALAEARAKAREKRDGAAGVSDEDLLPDAEFRFVDRDIRNLVRLDSGRVFAKDGNRRTYVVEVPPGEYTIFGAGIDGFTSGTCMCMGSVRFRAAAGEITDLGAVLVAPENGKTEIAELAFYRSPEYIERKALPFVMSVRPAKEGDPLPAELAGMTARPANYRAADKMPNWLGMLINRMPPIEGVLAYEADRVIDLAAPAEEAMASAGGE